MANPPALRWQTITDVLLKEIYDSDQAMYPAPQLTYDRLKSWVDAFPALSLCLQRGRAEASTHQESAENDAIHGLIIVLPLQQPYWDKLRRADIEEHDVDAMKMFPPLSASATRPHAQGSKTKVGLHVFHIERFPRFAATWKGARFTELALDEIRGRTTEAFESWEILGYSALTATQQGNAAFKRLGFTRSDPASGRNLLQQGAEMVERRGNESFSRQLSRITTEEKMKSPRA